MRISDDGSAGGIQAFGSWRWGVGMDSLRELLETVREGDIVRGRFRGLLHILVGRKITSADGTLISSGMSWRSLAALLKRVRWDRDAVSELELDPAGLPPRDRERYWYSVIARAGIDSDRAVQEANQLVKPLKNLGYVVGPAPGTK